MTFAKSLVPTIALALIGTALPGAANAAGGWQRNHPARAEINRRIGNQEHRITQERREGELTQGQAQALRGEDRSVLRQERADARADHNHGHLTGSQVHTLNQELNANSGAIGH